MYTYKNEFRIYLILYFDSDTDTELVRNRIGITEASAINRCDRRRDPFDDSKHLPGIWQVMFSYQNLRELTTATDGFLKIILPKLDAIVQVAEEYNAQSELLVVCDLDNAIPVLCFDQNFLHAANVLNAEIDIDIQADLAGVEYCSE